MDDSSRRPFHSVAEARQKALAAIQALKDENLPRITDTEWTSFSGYNYGRWADKGFNNILALLKDTPGEPGELGAAYLRRVCRLARARRDDFQADPADEDGACSAAIDAAVWAIMGLLPPAGPGSYSRPAVWVDPLPDVTWKLWYTDLFDRECPPSVELEGRGLARGLQELWARFLFEGVSPGGGLGLSRFHLWSEGRSIMVEGEWTGAAQLRHWLYGTHSRSRREVVEGGDDILQRVGVIHAQLLRDGVQSEPILTAATAAPDLEAFAAALEALNRP